MAYRYHKTNFQIGKAIAKAVGQKLPKPIKPTDLEGLKSVSAIVLGLIAIAGIATVAFVAPNALQLISKFLLPKSSSKKQKTEESQIKLTRAFYYLKSSGMINMSEKGNDLEASLTEKGEKMLEKSRNNALRISRQKAWNGRWWQVAADIPTEYYHSGADLFRKKLRNMGMYRLQRTLWFYPFDPREEIQFIAEQFGIQNYITIMEISRMDIEDEASLKTFFKASGVM